MTEEGKKLKVYPRTLIFDRERERQVAWLEGVLVLPVGSVVQLGEPNVDVKVVGVRLWASAEANVILDCEVPAEYWNEPRQEKPKLRLV